MENDENWDPLIDDMEPTPQKEASTAKDKDMENKKDNFGVCDVSC